MALTPSSVFKGVPATAGHEPSKDDIIALFVSLQTLATGGAFTVVDVTLAALPASGNTSGDLGLVLSRESDGGVYRWTGSAWSLAGPLPNILGGEDYAELAKAWAQGIEPEGAGTISAKGYSELSSASATTATAQAGISTAQAVVATGQASLAATHRSAAASSATQAELAALAAGAPIADTLSAGRAMVANGAVFMVFDEIGLRVYRRESASTETLLGWLVTSEVRIYVEQYGAVGDGVADDAAAINAADAAAAAMGIKRVVFRNAYLVNSQLLQSSGITWEFEGGEIIRNWTSKNSDKQVNATIRNRNAPTLAQFYVDPGPFIPTNVDVGCRLDGVGKIRMSTSARQFADDNGESAAGGPARMTQLWWVCHDAFIGGGIEFDAGGRDWCITYWGNGFRAGSFKITGGKHLYEDGFHVIGGHNGRAFAPTIESGDDCISFATNFNQAMSDWVIVAPSLFAAVAFGVKFANYRTGLTANYGPTTEKISNIQIISPTWRGNGGASRNGYVRFDTGAEAPDLVENCRVLNIDMQGENNGLPVGYTSGTASVSYNGSKDCEVTGVIRNPSQWALLINNAVNSKTDLVSPDPHNWVGSGGGLRAVDVRGASEGTKINGVYAGAVGGGALLINNGLTVESESLELTNTMTNQSAVTMSDDSKLTVSRKLTASKAAGATATRVVWPAVNCEVVARGVSYDLERFVAVPSDLKLLSLEYDPNHRTVRTVSTGALSLQGDQAVLAMCEGGVSDTVSVLSNGYDGQEVTIFNGEANPAVAVLTIIAGGNIAINQPYVLDTATKYARFRFNEQTGFWSEVAQRQIGKTQTYDPPSIAAGARVTTNVTVTGAAVGDHVQVTFSQTLAGLDVWGTVIATDTVAVTFANQTASAIDRINGTLRIIVTK